jgi:hypothetical protein
MVQGVTLDIEDKRFRVNLIVMPSLVLDVIMGMNRIKDWAVVIELEIEPFPSRIHKAMVLFKCHCLRG